MKVAIQLYSVRNHMQKDPLGTLREVAAIGYRNIEVANHNADNDCGVGFGVPAQEIAQVLREVGAQVISAHIFPMDAAKIEPVLEYHKQIGTRYIVMPMDFYKDRDDVLRKAAVFEEIGKKCAAFDMPLLYHNHFYEFQVFGGDTVYDLLMNNTDPAHLGIELDTYWAMRGGQDPLRLMERFGKRVRLVHQKDYPKGIGAVTDLAEVINREGSTVDMAYFDSAAKPEFFTEIGTGIMDIQSIIDAGNRHCACEYIILEQDHTAHDELQSIRISMESFRRFSGIEW